MEDLSLQFKLLFNVQIEYILVQIYVQHTMPLGLIFKKETVSQSII